VALRQAMTELGYVDGETIRYEYRGANNDRERYAALLQELVALEPAVIVTGGGSTFGPVSAATPTIPVVFAFGREGHFSSVGFGSVGEILERPDGNITGFINTTVDGADEVRFAKELVPAATRIGFLQRGDVSGIEDVEQVVRDAAASLGVEVVFKVVDTAEDAVPAYESVAAQDVDVMVVSGGGQFVETLAELANAARAARMPTTYRPINAILEGGLISHGVDQVSHWAAAASLVDRILQGEKPADIPVTKAVPLTIRVNLAEAKAIGLTVPDSILARATEIIDD